MKKVSLLLMLLVASYCVAQDCNTLIVDETGSALVQNNNNIVEAAHKLIDQGADVRVLVVGPTNNLDATESRYEKSCTSWQSGAGGRKSTLVVLMVSPSSRKLGIYYGAAWNGALGSHWNRIKQEYMVPYFKNKDWAGGFAATEEQLALRIAASKDEALHPAQTNVVNQAAAPMNLSGLLWFLGIFGAVGTIIFIIAYITTQSTKRKKLQADAVRMRNYCSSLLTAPQYVSNQALFDAASERYSQLAGRISGDPTADGLTIPEYESLFNQYQGIYRDLVQAKTKEPTYQSQASVANPFVTDVPTKAPSTPKRRSRRTERVVEKTVVNNTGSNDLVTGVILGESLSHHHHDDDDRGSSSSSSSSWSSSDSSSSSSGGGSSDFGSSSDWGGGGSSSFDSGSSGGGGGSSDF